MKQTAVEWLEEALEGTILTNEQIMQTIGLLCQAKELEKQQIIDAHGDKLKKSGGTSNFEYWFTGEEYYNKTFKK